MKLTKIALATAMTVASGAASAETFFYDNSVSVLYGESYEIGDSDKTVVTFEHYSANSWGDIFIFGDRLINNETEETDRTFNRDGSETYIEIAPRFKVSSFDAGIVKNLYIATTWEMSEANDDFLIGLGTDFNIPGFQNLSINAYQRLNDDGDNNYQTTTVWGIPFAIAGQNFMFDGFWDWATATDDRAATSNFTYQLKWDATQTLGTDNKVYVGIEHAIWNNKFAIEDGDFGLDTNENVISALVKVHF
ncbi:MAG: nucleoside-specific outer membrane channel protein Tsx [Bermanella sp.]|jgi:nucleoside-specific outer membrane channel protein Tsx